MSEAERVLSDTDVDAVARRVVELLRADRAATGASGEHLVWTCGEVAAAIGRSADFVREHRDELGVLPAEGRRPRLLFDPARVRDWASAREASGRPQAANPAPVLTSRRRRGEPSGTGVDLLPIHGDRRAA